MILLGVFSVMAIDWSFGYDEGASFTIITGTSWRSQSFNISTDKILDKINLTLLRTSGTPETCWVWISDNQAGHHIILSIATFNGSLLENSYENVTIDMPDIILTARTEYNIVMNCSTGDLNWKTANPSTFNSGKQDYSEDGGSSWAGTDYGQDSNFRLGLSSPEITFVLPTDENGDNHQRQNILVNVTVTGSFNSMTVYFYNSTYNLVGNVTSLVSPFFYNYSTGSDGIFYINATACNGSVCSSTETREVRLDTFNPVVDILYPDPDGLLFNHNIHTVNFTVLNTGSIDTCLVSVNNDTNISIPNCTEGNVMTYTGFNSTEGLNRIVVWANDTVGLYGSHTHTFTVDTIPPTINIISPINTVYISTTQTLSISSDGNVILYNFDGTNHTYTSPTSVVFNEGNNILNVYVIDNAGNFNSTSVSFAVHTPIPPAYESNVIYQLLNGSGAGLGIFFQLLAQALPLLLIGLAFAGIIFVIGMAIKKYLVEGGSP